MRTSTYVTTVPVVLFFMIALLSWRNTGEPKVAAPPAGPTITMCGSFAPGNLDSIKTPPKILPGLGNLSYAVTTRSSAAQAFFNQGLRLVYAFNHWEAILAFHGATQQDPECAMAYWGLAMAFGPNLNDWNPQDRERIALESVQKAIARKSFASQKERDMIDAMAARYDGKVHESRDSLNRAYADATASLAGKYPDDMEIQTLYADAIMNTMPWNYWNEDGSPRTETSIARKVLENVIRQSPDHSGAHHLYIHLVEASSTPEVALNSARFLENAMPNAGHIVHMPAHIYLRTGDYARALDLNVRAAKVDEEYLSGSGNAGLYRIMYYPHNIDFIAYSAYMEGRSELAQQTALRLAYKGNFITESAPGFHQYYGAEPMIAALRFGKWNDILALPDPGNNVLYSQVMYRFSRGLASLRKNDIGQAERELSKLDSLNKLDTLKTIYISVNPVSTSSAIATDLLRGELLIAKKEVDKGIQHLMAAVKAEDAMTYMEPPDWKLPTRHYLGAALYDAAKFADAELVYKKDLERNRENGWSLTGLQQCQIKQAKKAEAAATGKRLAKAWKNADAGIRSSRY